MYVIKGSVVMADQTVNAGEILIYEPEYAYEYHNEGETVYYWVHYTGFQAYSKTKDALGELNLKKYIGVHKELVRCFHNLFREFLMHDEVTETLSACFLQEILLFAGRYAGKKRKIWRPCRQWSIFTAIFGRN